jgi:hypothetical protein
MARVLGRVRQESPDNIARYVERPVLRRIDEHQRLLAAAKQSLRAAKNFVLEGHELPVEL